MSHTRLLSCFALLYGGVLTACSPTSVVGRVDSAPRAATTEPTYLLIRSDDAGMSHSVNMALERLIESGLPVSISVMFPTPWYQETVEILKRHPSVSVGIHLTLNSEWKNYRWGPVLGRVAVPSLVDGEGYFFGRYGADVETEQPKAQFARRSMHPHLHLGEAREEAANTQGLHEERRANDGGRRLK